MNDPIKYTSKEHIFICELIWGGIPIDKTWAIGTKLYQEMAPKIMAKYPRLDIDFHNLSTNHS